MSGDRVTIRRPPNGRARFSRRELLILVVDAMNHGPVPAVETAGILQAFLNCDFEDSPSRILQRIQEQFSRHEELVNNPFDGHLTACLVAALEAPSLPGTAGTIHVANAGVSHGVWNLPGDGAATPVRISGFLIGTPIGATGTADESFEACRIEMWPGDQVVLATDGLGELGGRDGSQLLAERLALLMGENRGEKLHPALQKEARVLRSRETDPDDLTFLVITAKKSANEATAP